MLIDLNLEGKRVVVVGGGSEGYRKTVDFLDAGAKILVVSQSFSSNMTKLYSEKKISILKEKIENAESFMDSFDPKPDIVVAVTSNSEFNSSLIDCAKSSGCMVYAPDNPLVSDFALPATASVGDVRIAVSTGGKSPAMASVLRKRIEKMITAEDLLQIKLQEYLRDLLKRQGGDQKVRKELLYKVIEDLDIQRLLKENKFEEAKEKAADIVQKT
ncbi:MAG: bifunctional precorrin-2 dehydrogenase/sirohydrochlorin ferrochelatase [Candidatus Bathyarchaeia archaeon]